MVVGPTVVLVVDVGSVVVVVVGSVVVVVVVVVGSVVVVVVVVGVEPSRSTLMPEILGLSRPATWVSSTLMPSEVVTSKV